MIQNDKKDTGLKVGGCCLYDSYHGHIQIIRIIKTPASIAQEKILGGAGYQGYEVHFRFIPQKHPFSNLKSYGIPEREHLLTLTNGWYVGPLYIEKYGLRQGEQYPAVLKIIKKGTCTPIIFELKEIDISDYFEVPH